MLDGVVPAAFQYVERADDVARDIAVRILQRISHPSLRSQVHDALKFLNRKQRGHAGLICQVELHEAETMLRLQSA